LPTWRLVRYVDDFAVLVNGDQNETEALREDVTQVLASMGGFGCHRPRPVCHRWVMGSTAVIVVCMSITSTSPSSPIRMR
jgi:hypothetical protein